MLLELDRWNVIVILFSSLDIVKTFAIYLMAIYIPEPMRKGLYSFKKQNQTNLLNEIAQGDLDISP